MTFNKKSCEGVSTYETPSVKSLDIMSEGVLCGSFDGDINNAYEEDWGTL